MNFRLVKKIVTLCLAVCILPSCSGLIVLPESQDVATLGPSPSAPAAAVPTQTMVFATPTLAVSPTSLPLPTQTPTPRSRPPSGWSMYSNPDFVQGIAVYQGHLWAATLGGVVDWNLNTKTPVVYTTRDGLVEIQGNAVAICPMPEDRVLVAHEIGILSVYDLGLRKWSRIPITFDDGSTLKGVRALRCDAKNNRLLVGSTEGLGILNLKTGRWKRIGKAEGLVTDSIQSIDVVGLSIWLAAGKQSAFLVMGNTVFPFNGASGFPSGPVSDLSVAPDFSIWFGYPTGLVHYQDKLWNSYGSQSSIGGIPFLSVDQVEAAQDKIIWIASAEEGVCPFNLVTLFCSTIYPSPEGAPITDLVVDEDGVAYAATDGGGILILKAEQRESLLLNREKLISNDILDIAESQDGTLWVATDRGVNYFDPNRPVESWGSILPARNGLNFSRVSGLLPVAGGMWFTNDEDPQASFHDESKWLYLNSSHGISGRVFDSAVDHRGYLWLATDQGIDVWDGVTMRSYGPVTGLPGNVYHTLLEKDGIMWVGTDQGLLRYDRFQWSLVLPGISINAIAPDQGDGLLLGSDQGLVLFDGHQSYQWIINLGEEIYVNTRVTALSRDHRGDLWVGTEKDGLFHYDGSIWEHFDTAHGLPTNQIQEIFTDHLGAVWIAVTTGQGGGALVRFVP